jgi:protein phosphatase 1G
MDELKRIAGIKKDDTNDEEAEIEEDKALLYEEACLPLEEVLKKYGIRVRFEGQQPQGGKKKFLSPPLALKAKRPIDGIVEEGDVDGQPTPPSSPDSRVDATKNDSVVEKIPTKRLKRERNGKMKNFLENIDNDDEMVKCDLETIGQNDENQLVEDGLPNVKRVKEANHITEEALCQLPDSASEIGSNRTDEIKENGHAPASTTIDLLPKIDDEDDTSDSKFKKFDEAKPQSANLQTSGVESPMKFVKKTVEQMLLNSKKEADSSINNLPADGLESESNDEDDEYKDVDEEDSSGETGDESVEEDEIVDEEEEENEGDENEEEDEDGMFPVPSGETPGVDSGTTACVAVIKENTIYVANAGDSRCVLCREGDVAFDLSADHKPEDTKEKDRIEKAGGKITGDGRVNGGLNLSRAIGDHFYKKNTTLPLKDQMITSLPDICVETLRPTDKFLVLACDGIWNSMNSQEVVDFISLRLKNGVSAVKICEQLCDRCLAPSTAGDGTGCDNMTAIIVQFKHNAAEKCSPSVVSEQSNSISSTTPTAVDNHCSNEENT